MSICLVYAHAVVSSLNQYYEGNTYPLSVVPDVKSVEVTFKGETLNYNALSGCKSQDLIKVISEKWGLTKYYLISAEGRAFVGSTWVCSLSVFSKSC